MAKAPAAEQLKLLELQGFDARLKSLENQRRTLEADPRLVDLNSALSVARSEQTAAATAVHDASVELKKAEADVELVATRISRDEAKLNSGTGLSKDLMALQTDIASLNRRRSDLEDVELEVMERLEGLKEKQEAQQQIVDQITESLTGIRADVDGQLAAISTERATVTSSREEFAATVEPALLAIYEKTLAKRGVGAARLFHGRSEGSGMQLSPGDLAEIKNAPEDEVVFCPDSGCVLVRSAEWN
ncbi:zinc ribbon domain-containing protein [Pseudarthrobacter sp. J1738]|uniref:zinc ribbon domain-containing protein n=1 Tax=unclassified Pseudarthrobacter TaxID=2647000 RepID=UPI003D2AEB9F